MIKLVYNDKAYIMPTTAKEVSLWQWQALLKAYRENRTETWQLIGALTGLDEDAVLLSEGNSDECIYHLHELLKGFEGIEKAKHSKAIEIDGQSYSLPKSWNNCTLGQRIYMQSAIKGYVDESMHTMLAIIVAPQVYGEEWMDSVEELAESIKNCPALGVAPIAYFFLRNRMYMKRNGKVKYLSLLIRSIKIQAVRKWKSLASLT